MLTVFRKGFCRILVQGFALPWGNHSLHGGSGGFFSWPGGDRTKGNYFKLQEERFELDSKGAHTLETVCPETWMSIPEWKSMGLKQNDL